MNARTIPPNLRGVLTPVMCGLCSGLLSAEPPASPLSQFDLLTRAPGPSTPPAPARPPAESPSPLSAAPLPPATPPPARTSTNSAPLQPSASSGFSDRAPSYPVGGGLGDSILEGFGINASFTGIYDTNVTQSPGEPIAPIQDDFIMGAGIDLKYLSSATEWTFGGNYNGNYESYLNNDEFSGYSQGAGLVGNYDGTRLNVSANLSADLDRGANRYYSSSNFSQRTTLNAGINARYKLSAKTFLQGNLGGNLSLSDDSGYGDTSSFDMGAAALWKYSPLTEFGPGIRYTFRSGDSQLDRSSLGPTLTVNYKLSSKVGLNSRIGVDLARYEDGTTADPTLSASIGLNYQASKLWSMNLSFFRDTQADPSTAGAYQEIGTLRLGYSRKVQRARLNLGMSLESNTTEFPGDSSPELPTRDYVSLDASIGMPILTNTTYASIFTRYSQRNGSTSDTWDSVQAGFSISRGF